MFWKQLLRVVVVLPAIINGAKGLVELAVKAIKKPKDKKDV